MEKNVSGLCGRNKGVMWMDDYNMDGYRRLAAAVVETAVIDYTRALRRLRRNPYDRDALHGKRECERFFRYDIDLYSDLDGETIIRAIQEKVDREMRH